MFKKEKTFMKNFIYCLAALPVLMISGCAVSGDSAAEKMEPEYDSLLKAGSPQPVRSLADCLKYTGKHSNWQREEQIIRDYFKLGSARLIEKSLLEKLTATTTPQEEFAIKLQLIDITKQRNLVMISLCRNIGIHPGTPIETDFQVPEKLTAPDLPPLEKIEQRVVASPLLKNLPVIERLKIFRFIYTAMIAAREKTVLCRQYRKPVQTIAAYAEYCIALHKLYRLSGIKVEKFGAELLQKKNFIISLPR